MELNYFTWLGNFYYFILGTYKEVGSSVKILSKVNWDVILGLLTHHSVFTKLFLLKECSHVFIWTFYNSYGRWHMTPLVTSSVFTGLGILCLCFQLLNSTLPAIFTLLILESSRYHLSSGLLQYAHNGKLALSAYILNIEAKWFF